MAERAFTRWHPDTCSCIVEYYTDDVYMHHQTIRSCNKHSPDHGQQSHLDKLYVHNRYKNTVINHVRSQLPEDEAGPADAVYDPNAPVDDDPIVIVGVKQAHRNRIEASLRTLPEVSNKKLRFV